MSVKLSCAGAAIVAYADRASASCSLPHMTGGTESVDMLREQIFAISEELGLS